MERIKKLRLQNNDVKVLTEILQKMYQNKLSYDFQQPVDWQSLGLSDYPLLIIEPMDLSTVQKKLKGDYYDVVEGFFEDLMLIWRNCQTYNGPGHPLSINAAKLEQETKKCMKNYFPNIRLKHKKAALKKNLDLVKKQEEPQKESLYQSMNEKRFSQMMKCEKEQRLKEQAEKNLRLRLNIPQNFKLHQFKTENVQMQHNLMEEVELNQTELQKAVPDQSVGNDKDSQEYKIKKLFIQSIRQLDDDKVQMLYLTIKRRCPSTQLFDEEGYTMLDLTYADYQTIQQDGRIKLNDFPGLFKESE